MAWNATGSPSDVKPQGVAIDGEFIPLEWEKLGHMEFCRKDGLLAELDGKIVDGKYVASSFKYHEH